jgi:hypothetical protein
MIKYFDSVQEFTKFKTKCVFCQNDLKVVLRDFDGINGTIPVVNSKCIEDAFKFHVNYNSISANINCDVSMSCIDNTIVFSDSQAPSNYKISWFKTMGLHVELYCPKRACGLKYYISSDVLELQSIQDGIGKLKPIKLYMECFNLDKIWIQNDFQHSSTNIFSVNNPDADPIQMVMLDFGAFEKEKLFNKVRTHINFS